jgi:nitrous oxide reductase
MPHSDEMLEPGPQQRQDQETGQPSRRSVLRGAAGAGAAGLAMTTLAGTALAGPALAATRDRSASADHATAEEHDGEDVVVHVRNVRSGEMDVYHGTSHVKVTDRALAARLARASH